MPVRVAQGGEVRSGRLGLEVLWPPADRLVEPLAGEDPNLQALVILARWRDFTMLLTADAEAESVPIDPGPLDVLKVAHHGSDDGGLGALLNRSHRSSRSSPWGSRTRTVTRPRAPLRTLAAHGVRTLRTDRDGNVVIEVGPDSIEIGG